MILAIKYCGGCNPHYERGKMARELTARLTHTHGDQFSYENWSPDKSYELCLVVKGCSRCISIEQGLSNCQSILTAEKPEDFSIIEQEINARMAGCPD